MKFIVETRGRREYVQILLLLEKFRLLRGTKKTVQKMAPERRTEL